MVTVLFFAGARDAANASSREYELGSMLTVDELAARIIADTPSLGQLLPFVRFAVNGKFADGSRRIADGDEIALLPPVSGG